MTRFLVPYIWPLIGALVAALIAAIGWIMLQSAWLDQAEADRDAAISYIQGRKETDDAQDSLPDDPDDLVKWLRDFAE